MNNSGNLLMKRRTTNVSIQDHIEFLSCLVSMLMDAQEALTEYRPPKISNNIDFYETTYGHPQISKDIDFFEEVAKFEISLIQRALRHANGCQYRAASLLNLKSSTLNSKIKRLKIPWRLSKPDR